MNAFAARFLYALEAPLPPPVVLAYVQALVCVARANGIVESELSIIQGVAEILGAPARTVSRVLADKDAGVFDRALAVLVPHARLRSMVYRDALLVMRADGRVTVEEKALLMRLSTQLGLDRAQRIEATLAADVVQEVEGTMRALADGAT
jgi:uncharacterized tellurite resistance protein B-like protein